MASSPEKEKLGSLQGPRVGERKAIAAEQSLSPTAPIHDQRGIERRTKTREGKGDDVRESPYCFGNVEIV
jgi:hypothetical protein